MFYFKFHIGDYRRETSHLTLLEHGVYMSLMSTYYASEQPLPKDERQLLRLAGARTEEEKQAVIDVVNEFFIPTETHWVHSRIDFELREYQSKADVNRKNGKKGGRPKKNSPQKPNENPSGYDSLENKTQTDSETKPNENPDETLTHKPINPLTNKTINNKSSNNDDLVVQVFTYWQKVFNKNRTKLDAKRKSKIKARLADGRTLIEIQTAIDNCSKSEFHTTNGHIDIELICRDDSKFESFLSRSNKPIQPQNNNHNGYIDFSTIGNKPEIEILVHGVHDEPSNDYPF